MNNMRMLLPVLLHITSCNSIEVHTRYDFNKDSKTYNTYNFTKESTELELNDYNKNLLINLISEELEIRGYTKSETPDYWVNLDATVTRKLDPITYQNRSGRDFIYDRDLGLTNVESHQTYITTAGKIFIDFIDSDDQDLIWQGVATGLMDSPDKNSISIIKAVKKIFKQFPN